MHTAYQIVLTTYVNPVNCVDEGISFEARQQDKFSSVIQASEHHGSHAVDVEEREDAQVYFLERVRNVIYEN